LTTAEQRLSGAWFNDWNWFRVITV